MVCIELLFDLFYDKFDLFTLDVSFFVYFGNIHQSSDTGVLIFLLKQVIVWRLLNKKIAHQSNCRKWNKHKDNENCKPLVKPFRDEEKSC